MTDKVKPGAVAAHGLRGNDPAGRQINPVITAGAIGTQAAPLRVIVTLTASGRKWIACLGDRVLCRSAWPFVMPARLLLAEGYPADTVIEMWRSNTDEWALRGCVGAVAATVIDAETATPKFTSRKPDLLRCAAHKSLVQPWAFELGYFVIGHPNAKKDCMALNCEPGSERLGSGLRSPSGRFWRSARLCQ